MQGLCHVECLLITFYTGLQLMCVTAEKHHVCGGRQIGLGSGSKCPWQGLPPSDGHGGHHTLYWGTRCFGLAELLPSQHPTSEPQRLVCSSGMGMSSLKKLPWQGISWMEKRSKDWELAPQIHCWSQDRVILKHRNVCMFSGRSKDLGILCWERVAGLVL